MEDPGPEVLERLRGGDHEAFRRAVEAYQDILFDLALRMTGSRHDAEDLVQEAFLRMFRNIGRYDPRQKFSTWAYTVTLNLVRNHLRRRSLIRFLSLDWSGPEDGEASEPPADPAEAPERQLERSALAQELDVAVSGLPRALKEAFVLFYFHEQDVRSIAQLLGASENAVKLKLMRARRRVHTQIYG